MKTIDFSIDYTLTDLASEGSLLERAKFDQIAERIDLIGDQIERNRGLGPLAFMNLPKAYYPSKNPTCFGGTLVRGMKLIKESADRIHQSEAQYIHLGIGGSALCAITLLNSLEDHNTKPRRHPLEVLVLDNIDPDQIIGLLSNLNPQKTYINVVSKSGGTVETIANFAIFLEFLRKADLSISEIRKRVFITTNPEKGVLMEFAMAHNYTLIPLPENVHGRFSVFAPTGLFTAAVAGIDIDNLLEGAQYADEMTASATFWENPSKLLAAVHFLGNEQHGLKSLVLMPYSYRLRTVADWYSQLVAESLGKNGKGITPIKALGVTDQHSQLQLYNDGPKDKIIVFFGIKDHKNLVKIPDSISQLHSYDYLKGRTVNDLVSAEQNATAISLHLHGIPSCTFMLDSLSPFSVGALLTILEKTVCILGQLYGLNAFDQPGVEESKEYTRAIMGKPGKVYDSLRDVLAKKKSKTSRAI